MHIKEHHSVFWDIMLKTQGDSNEILIAVREECRLLQSDQQVKGIMSTERLTHNSWTVYTNRLLQLMNIFAIKFKSVNVQSEIINMSRCNCFT